MRVLILGRYQSGYLNELAHEVLGVPEGHSDDGSGGLPPGADGLVQVDGESHHGASGADEAAVQLGQLLVIDELRNCRQKLGFAFGLHLSQEQLMILQALDFCPR